MKERDKEEEEEKLHDCILSCAVVFVHRIFTNLNFLSI